MLVITLFAVLLRRKFPAALFGWLWYVGTLVPVNGIISVGSQSHADRYTYTPLIGIFLGIACIAATLSAGRRALQAIVASVGIALLLGASVVTWRQMRYWKDTTAAMQRCLDVDPGNYLAHRTLGLDYDVAGDVTNAVRKYNDALQYNPHDPDALRQMARLMYEQGDNEQAKIFYRRAMFAEPFDGAVYNNYANLLMKEGRTEDAIKVYRSGIKHDPETTGNYYNLGLALAQAGEINEAVSLWQSAVNIDPNYADAHASLGAAYVMQGKTREGLTELRTALRLKPNRIDVMNQLAWTLAVHPSPLYRNAPEAERIARQAIEKSGGKDAASFDALAAALAQQGKFDEAISTAQKGAEVADSLHTKDGDALAAQIRKRIGMYRVHQPFTSE
jgi:tetratricopeptide (TPR) repeat protein